MSARRPSPIPPDILERIRDVPIEQVLLDFGARRRWKSWHCLFHDDRNPSASVKHNRLHCFFCNRTWDTIGVVMAHLSLDFLDAAHWLADHFGIQIPDHQPTPEQRQEFGRRKAAAEWEADEFLAWKKEIFDLCRTWRNRLWDWDREMCRFAMQQPETDDLDSVFLATKYASDAAEKLENAVRIMLNTPDAKLLELFRKHWGWERTAA